MGTSKHYIDNTELLAELISFQSTPIGTPIPESLALKIQLIAQHLGSKRNWNAKVYRDHEDMLCHGTLCGLESLRKFDTTKSAHPFNYFTTIIQNAFRCWRSESTQQDLVESLLLRDTLHSSDDLYLNSQQLIERETAKADARRARDREKRHARRTQRTQ